MHKALIEKGDITLVDLFDKISKEAKKEKNAVPPINKILYWWTRKPLIVSKAIALLSLYDENTDINDVINKLNLNKDKRAYTHNSNINIDNKIKVLDPFAGAGNLIFEAKRLGLDCYAMDYNPVAYLIEKAILEYPSKYPNLSEDVEHYGKQVIELTRKELDNLYNRDGRKALAYLYAWCILCPYCKQRIPLMNHSWLANTNKKKIGIKIKPNDNKDFSVEIVRNISENEGKYFTKKKGKAICINCKSSIDYNHLTSDIAKRRDFELLVVVVKENNGKDYELANDKDRENIRKAKELLNNKFEELKNDDLIPLEKMGEELSGIKNYGFTQWYQIFNPRQLLLMSTILKNIRIISKEIETKDKDYAKVIATYLAFMLCKHIDYNSIGISWHVTYEKIGHTLAMRNPRVMYNFAETNPFEKTSGSLNVMLKNIVDAIKFASKNNNNVNINLGSVLHLQYDKEFDLIITDPPYLDDVAYGELSEFFYVWLYRALKDYYPELPARVPLDEDIVLSKNRFNSNELAMQFYINALKQAFKKINKALKDDGLAVIFFAHSSIEAWDLLLNTLREAKLQVVSSYTVHTEMQTNVLARNKTSFMSSIVISCRKVNNESSAYLEDLIPKMEDRINELLKNIDKKKLLQLPITDLLIMIYGEVLEVATAYARLKSYSNEEQEFTKIIEHARDYIMRVLIRKLIDREVNVIGNKASLYIIGKVFFNNLILADNALHIKRAYNIDDNTLNAIAKKEKGNISLLSFKEIKDLEKLKPEEIDSNDIHKQLMYIEYIADSKGANKVNSIINSYNFRVNELKSIISLLINSYRIKKNKGVKLSNNDNDEYNILLAIADTIGLKTGESIDKWL